MSITRFLHVYYIVSILTTPLLSKTLQSHQKTPVTSPYKNAGISWENEKFTYSLIFLASAATRGERCLHLSQTSSQRGVRSSFYALSPIRLPFLVAAMENGSTSPLQHFLVGRFFTSLHEANPYRDGNLAKGIIHLLSDAQRQITYMRRSQRSSLRTATLYETANFGHYVL